MRRLELLLVAISVFFISGCSITLASDVTPPPDYQETPIITPSQAEARIERPENLLSAELDNGQAIYLEKCEPCHGVMGKGGGSMVDRLSNPPPEIGSAELARKSVPLVWYQIITEGRLEKQMPPFSSLSVQQRWDVLAYVYSLSSSQDRIQQGKEIYANQCANCHALDGAGGPQASAVDFSAPDWALDKSLESIHQLISTGKSPAMPAFEGKLSDEEIWMVSEFIRSLSVLPAGDAALSEDSSVSEGEPTPEAGDISELSPEFKTGMISGDVTNGSGGEVQPGLEIVLHGFDDMQSVLTQTTQLREDGSYQFDNIEFIPGRAFVSTIEFDGLTYGSNIVAVEGSEDSIELPIEIFESTTNASDLVIERLHLFLEPIEGNVLRVIELLIISNKGTKTVRPVSDSEPSLLFSLPERAINLEFQDGELGERFIQTQDGFGDLAAIRPGMNAHQILFAFELPADQKVEINQPLKQSTNAVVVLVPESGLKVKSEQLQDGGTREVEGLIYRMYNGRELAAGDQLELFVSRQSAKGLPRFSPSSTPEAGIGLGILAATVIAAGVWLYQINKRQKLPVGKESTSSAKPVESPESIMDAILALDDLYKEGQIPEEPYRKRRAELKDRLRELMA